MKKIGLLCLCFASLGLAGCFHVPDEDWLPSKNEVNNENVKKDEEVEQAINALMQGIDMISSGWNQVKNDEIGVEYTGELEDFNTEIKDENIITEEIINDDELAGGGNGSQEIQENTISEEQN